MDAKVYEVLALAMRYFFTFMGVMIVWRAFSWLRKDRNLKHKRLKQLPDAGTIGILTVLAGSKQLRDGQIIPVPHEGVLGYLRTCDVVVPVDDVATTHLDFTFADGKGLFIYPRRGCEATVDGIPLTSRRISRQHPMQHGSVLEIGQAVLQLGVFAGLNVPEARPVPAMPQEPFVAGPYSSDQPNPYVQPPYYPQQNPPYPQNPAWQQGAYPPPYAGPMNPPPQSPYAGPMNSPAPPYGPPYQPMPWQGGDDDGQ